MTQAKPQGAPPPNIYAAISLWMPTFSNIETRIATFFLDNSTRIAEVSMAEAARVCRCSEGSIDRFCKKLGCTGYAQARNMLASQQPPSADLGPHVRIDVGVPIGDLIRNIQDLYTQTLYRIEDLNSPENFELAIRKIREADNLYFFGIGDALIPCMTAYYRFRRIGFPCFFDADSDMQMINASMIRSGDVVIAVSHSGMSRHVNEALRAAREAGAFSIGITQSVKAPMTQFCDLLFFNSISDVTVGKTIVAHRLAESTIIEVLYAGVMALDPGRATECLRRSSKTMEINKES